MATKSSPTLRRRELANRLRELRGRAQITLDDAAAELLCSPAKISRIETGARPASLRDVRDLCRLYEADAAEQEHLMTLAREAQQQGWWQRYSDLAIESLIGLEIGASKISSYESSVIPWAFQTEAYARAVIKGILPRIAKNILDQRVAARLKRQDLLASESPPQFWALIDESALYRKVGSHIIMQAQLARIIEVSEMPNITIQVVPYEAGAHPGLNNTFSLLEFDDPQQSPVAFIENENMGGAVFLERPAEIEKFREALEHLRAAALSPAQTTSLIERVGQITDAR